MNPNQNPMQGQAPPPGLAAMYPGPLGQPAQPAQAQPIQQPMQPMQPMQNAGMRPPPPSQNAPMGAGAPPGPPPPTGPGIGTQSPAGGPGGRPQYRYPAPEQTETVPQPVQQSGWQPQGPQPGGIAPPSRPELPGPGHGQAQYQQQPPRPQQQVQQGYQHPPPGTDGYPAQYPNNQPNMVPSSSYPPYSGEAAPPRQAAPSDQGVVGKGVQDMSRTASNKPKIDPSKLPSPIELAQSDSEETPTVVFNTTPAQPPPPSNHTVIMNDLGGANVRYMRSTMYNLPSTDEMLKSVGANLGVIVQPLAHVPMSEPPVLVVGAEDDEIENENESWPIRCRRCRAYMCSFMNFTDGGRSYECCICKCENDVPRDYFCPLDISGRRRDADERPELCRGTFEYRVGSEYWPEVGARRPAAPGIVFAIDVSAGSFASGLATNAIEAVKAVIDELPDQTIAAVVTYNTAVHFYDLSSEEPQMLVVSDLEDVFLPLARGALVRLGNEDGNADNYAVGDGRAQIHVLLDKIPTLFSNAAGNQISSDSAFGSAMHACHFLLSHCGGRVVAFQHGLPTIGPGKLKNRLDPKLFGTEKETALYQCQSDFYADLSEMGLKNGIGVDLFICASGYADLATVSVLPSRSGGALRHYSGLSSAFDQAKLLADVKSLLLVPHGEKREGEDCGVEWGVDGIIKLRSGGNYSVKSVHGPGRALATGEVQLAVVDSHQAVGLELEITNDNDDVKTVCFQVALLYTHSSGERRVRVMTNCFEVTTSLSSVYRYTDLDACVSMEAKKCAMKVQSTTLGEIRDALTETCVDVLSTYRRYCASSTSAGQLILPESLKLFPVYALGMTKNYAFKPGTDTPLDIRVISQYYLMREACDKIMPFLYPRVYNLTFNKEDSIDSSGSKTLEHQEWWRNIRLPRRVGCSSEYISNSGVYIGENGSQILVRIGPQTPPNVIEELIGQTTIDNVDMAKVQLSPSGGGMADKIRDMVKRMQYEASLDMSIRLTRQHDFYDGRFFEWMVEDRIPGTMSYVDWLCHLHRHIQGRFNVT